MARSDTGIYAAGATCVRGHPYTPENTAISATGHRICRACERVRAEERSATARARTALNGDVPPPMVKDTGCPKWGIPSCLTCPLSVCKEEDYATARCDAIALGLIKAKRSGPPPKIEARAQVLALLMAGATHKDAAHQAGVHQSIVTKWRRLWERQGHHFPPRQVGQGGRRAA